MLSRAGRAIDLTCDHKPARPDELQRIEAAGGRVLYAGGYRLMGALSISRSIGDHVLQTFGLTSKPEVRPSPR